MDFYGWGGIAEKLSAQAAKGEWADMPKLITDEMLNEFCLVTSLEKLARELKSALYWNRRPSSLVHSLCAGREG